MLVYMDDGLAIITLSPGSCQDLPPLVHRVEAGMDGWIDRWIEGWINGSIKAIFVAKQKLPNDLQKRMKSSLCIILKKMNMSLFFTGSLISHKIVNRFHRKLMES